MQPPSIETLNSSDVRQHFATLLNRVYRHETRVLVEKSGIPVAAIVSTADLERVNRRDQEISARFALLEEFRAPFRDIPPEELDREIESALAEIRAEHAVPAANP